MKFSDRTLTILKNFATINPSLVMHPGKEIRTMSLHKNVMAVAQIEDEIPSQACIYDMSRFLSVYGLYKSPDIEFNERSFIIKEGKRKTNYIFADPSMVVAPPKDKKISVPNPEVEVSVEWDDLQAVIKASGVLQLPEIAFVGEEGTLYLRAIDSSNPSADTFGVELGETNDEFQLIFKNENLKMLPADYKVKLSSKGISEFQCDDIKYFIAIESKSSFNKGEE